MAYVGVSDHAGWAVLVTIDDAGDVVDRRRVLLKDASLPALPHHDASRRLPLSVTVDLVETVRQSAMAHSARALEDLDAALTIKITGIALRAIPDLPASVAERITNLWANARADGVLYREALAHAGRLRGWRVHWLELRQRRATAQTPIFASADADAAKRFSPPWNNDHRIALAGAIAGQRADADG